MIVGFSDRQRLLLKRDLEAMILTQASSEKAAVLMRSLIANHAFFDGNKRAGLFAALLFLRINGQDFDAPDDLVYKETIAVACRERSVEEIAGFLATYSNPFSP